MKKGLILIGVFIGAYLIFVIQSMPAAVVLKFVSLPKNIKVGVVNGSIWQFNVSFAQIDNLKVNDIKIKMNLASLLTLDPSVDVEFGNPMAFGPAGSARLSGLSNQLTISDANVTIAANDIAQQLPLIVPVQAKSDVELNIHDFQLGQPVCESLTGRVDWRTASVTVMEENVTLGDLAALLRCEDGEVIVQISPDNHLGLTFEAIIAANFQIHGNGFLKPTVETPAAVSQALAFLGKPDDQGRYRLKF